MRREAVDALVAQVDFAVAGCPPGRRELTCPDQVPRSGFPGIVASGGSELFPHGPFKVGDQVVGVLDSDGEA